MRFAIPLCGIFFVEWPLMTLWGEIELRTKTNFQAPKNYFFAHAWTASNPLTIYMWIDLGTWNIVFPNTLKKTWAFQKNNFSGSKKCCVGPALVKLRQARLWKKKSGSFVCFLSNLPTPPPYLAFDRSKLRRCIQYITKNFLRIWGALDLLWWKFACM